MAEPTKKEIEALRWLIARKNVEAIHGSALWQKYESESDLRSTAMRVVAWKRTSQRTLNRLREAGLLAFNSAYYRRGHHGAVYDVTEAGFEAAR